MVPKIIVFNILPIEFLDNRTECCLGLTNRNLIGEVPNNNDIKILINKLTAEDLSHNSLSNWAADLNTSKTSFSDRKDITINGVPAIRGNISYTLEDGTTSTRGIVHVKLENNIGYDITWLPFNSDLIEEFDKVINTFEFK